jgi:hypothetical protein
MFQGFILQESTINTVLVCKDSNDKPTNADALPTWRVYGPNGFLGLSGTCSLLDSNTIQGASNANPIVITSASHGLSSGAIVTISGVGGNTNANATTTVTVVDSNTFSIPLTGNGSYTSGGVWNLAGAYKAAIAATGANGFAAGTGYDVVYNFAISSALKGEVDSFAVV